MMMTRLADSSSDAVIYHGWGVDLTQLLAAFTNPTTKTFLPKNMAEFYNDQELLPQSIRVGHNQVRFPEDPEHLQNYALIPDISPVLSHTEGLQVFSHHQAIQLLVKSLNQTLFNHLSVYELTSAQAVHDSEAWSEIHGNIAGALEHYLEQHAGPVEFSISAKF